MIKYKIYTKGSMFYLVDINEANKVYEAHAKDVLIKKFEEDSVVFFINNLSNWDSLTEINPLEVEDADSVAYTVESFVAFIESNTGFNQASGSGATGYGVYFDDQYTSVATALSTTNGNTSIVDINGSTVLRGQMPIGVTEMYDVATSKIIPIKENDGFAYTLSFYAQNTVTEGAFEIFLDLGGGFTEVFGRVTTFPRGSNTTQPFTFSTQGYQGATFKANGGLIKIKSDRGTTKIFNISLQIHKTHDAR